MEKVLFADLSEKERIQMLSDNADTVEEVGYMKAFTPEEMETMKDRLSKIVIDINDIDEEKKAVNDEFKLRKKPLETEKQELLANIKSKSEYVVEDCYKFCDHDEQMVGFYNKQGVLVDCRPMRPDERQTTLFQALRPETPRSTTGTDND